MTGRTKSVLVTGASSGIGYTTAIEFAKRGYQVFAGARRLERMARLESEYGINIVELDVTSTESVQKVKKLIVEKTGGTLDVLYNNAGQHCAFPALDLKDEYFEKCFAVNVFGPMRVVREFGPLVIKAKGVIGFTGSVAGIVAFPFSSVYGATKAAIHQYADTLKLELEPFEVKVVNFVTGGVQSEIGDDRSLSSDSVYNVPPMEESLLERREMARRNHPMSSSLYSYKVVNDFERAKLNGPLHIYRGKMATFLYFVSRFLPRFILVSGLKLNFKLKELFQFLKNKYAKKTIKANPE